MDDAEAMSRVLVASIGELCRADHGGDPAVVAAWTANKSAAGVAGWIANPDNRLFVAEDDGEVLGVAGFRGDEILLNYVVPSARFRGVSRAMLAHIEATMRMARVAEARLTSTLTAHRFYVSAGWDDRGMAPPAFGISGSRRMSKKLS